MHLFSRISIRLAKALTLAPLAFALAQPASSQTKPSDDTIQVIAQQQSAISQTYKMERLSENIMYLENLALLAAYGDWSRYDPSVPKMGAKRIENLKLHEHATDQAVDLIYAKKAMQRNKSVSEDELKRFSDIYLNVETLSDVAIDVHDLLEDGRIDEANALYRDKSIPLRNAINRESYTLISSLEAKIAKTALQARVAK